MMVRTIEDKPLGEPLIKKENDRIFPILKKHEGKDFTR
jgi:hypothetical protein